MEENVAVKKEKKRRPRFYEITPENDIKFRGRLSYRHFRILGWLFLIVAQIAVLLNLDRFLSGDPSLHGFLPIFLSFFADLMPPLFLIAVFSVVLVAKDGYRRLITMHGGLAILVVVAFLILYAHYMSGLLGALFPGEGFKRADKILLAFTGEGYFAFNIFIDLTLCSLVTFFINYTPKNHFQGKKIYIFRLLVLLPIIYEVVSIILKMLASSNVIQLSPFFFPFLTTKAPMTFIIFLIIAWFFKRRERIFIKKGKTLEEYEAFKKTNTNTLQFSIFLSVVIAIAVILDTILFIAISIAFCRNGTMPAGEEEQIIYIAEQCETVYNWGFGKTIPMLLIIPLIIFFDYQKTYKNSLIDLLIPIGGVALVIFVNLEGGFEVIRAALSQSANSSS